MGTQSHGGHGLDDVARAQLDAIAALGVLLDRAGIDHWLFGGWAADFWVGHVTRAHDDADLAVRLDDRGVIDEILVAEGWVHTPEPGEDVGTRYRHGAVLLELTFVVEQEGVVLLPFGAGPVVWSTAPFGDSRRDLDGVTARVQALEVLRHDKSRPRQDDARDAVKDRADYEALSRTVVGEP